MQVRRLRGEEWQRWRSLRLRALADAPYAFATTYAEASAWSDDEWVERTARFTSPTSALFLAEDDDGTWLGCAGCYVDDDDGHPQGGADPRAVPSFVIFRCSSR